MEQQTERKADIRQSIVTGKPVPIGPRPPNSRLTEAIRVRMTSWLKQRVCARARAEDRDVAEWVRRLIEQYFANQNGKKKKKSR